MHLKKGLLAACLLTMACQFAVAFQPTSAPEHTVKEIEGWQVHVSNKLLNEQADLGKKALRQLEHQLYQIKRLVPVEAVGKIQKVHIWLGNDAPYVAVYHPSRKWLADNGQNPDKAKCVEISSLEKFLAWTKPQPYMVLHELAHAYHHQFLGYDHPQIKDAYKKAMDQKQYDSVLHINGNTEKHYATNNDQEYFAEGTEAFFGTNDFFPFVRAELKEHDPQLYDVMKKVWKAK